MIEFIVYIVVVMVSIILLKFAGKKWDLTDEDKQNSLLVIVCWPLSYPFLLMFGLVALFIIPIMMGIEKLSKIL